MNTNHLYATRRNYCLLRLFSILALLISAVFAPSAWASNLWWIGTTPATATNYDFGNFNNWSTDASGSPTSGSSPSSADTAIFNADGINTAFTVGNNNAIALNADRSAYGLQFTNGTGGWSIYAHCTAPTSTTLNLGAGGIFVGSGVGSIMFTNPFGGTHGYVGVNLTADQTWNLSSDLTASFLSGAYRLTKTGPGNLYFTVPGLNWAGTNAVNAGNLSVGSASLTNATLDWAAGDSGTISFSGATGIGALTGSRDLNLGGTTITIGYNSASTTFSGALTNGTLVKTGTGTLTLSGASTYPGSTVVNGGTLAITNSGGLYAGGYTATPGVAVNSGATLSVYAWAYGPSGGLMDLDLGAGRLSVSGGIITYTGVGEGSGSGNNGRLFTIGTGGATLDAEGTGTWFLETSSGYDGTTGQIIPSGLTLTLSGAGNGKYDKYLSGAGALVKSGAGTWTLNNTNSYSGGTSNLAGILEADFNNALGTGLLTMNGGTLSNNVSATLTNGVNLSSAATIGVSSSHTLTLSGSITNNGALIKVGAGTLTLSSTNTYSGGTTISNGTVTLGGTYVAGSLFSQFGTGMVTVNSGGQILDSIALGYNSVTMTNPLTLNGGALHVGGGAHEQWTLSGPITTTTTAPNTTNSILCDGGTGYNGSGFDYGAAIFINGPLDMGSNTNTLTCYGGDVNGGITINGSISGTSGTILCTASHLWLANASNSFVGTIRCSAASATVVFNAGNQVNNMIVDMNAADAGAFTFANPCTIGGLMGSRNLGISGALSIGRGNASTTYSGALTNSGSVTKIGTGTLILNGSNTYTGQTTVSNGTLGGIGVISGPVTVAAGGTLAPGNPTGNLTINNNFTNAGTVFMALDAGSLTVNQVVGVNNASYGGSLVVSNTSATALAPHAYQLFTASGTKTGNFANITVLGAGAGGVTAAFNPATGQLTLASAVVPQPGINQVTVSAGNLVLQGTNGTASGTYSVLTATNAATPMANWITNTTGVFGPGGVFSNAIPFDSNQARFFRIRTP